MINLMMTTTMDAILTNCTEPFNQIKYVHVNMALISCYDVMMCTL